MSDDRHCPTCGFVMCGGFDYEPINELATLATPNDTFNCLSGRCDEKGFAVDCAVCGKRKAPRGPLTKTQLADAAASLETLAWMADDSDQAAKAKRLRAKAKKLRAQMEASK